MYQSNAIFTQNLLATTGVAPPQENQLRMFNEAVLKDWCKWWDRQEDAVRAANLSQCVIAQARMEAALPTVASAGKHVVLP